MKKTVSVIIPVYNQRKELLIRSYESVKKQDYEDIECIIVDDGSTDGTEALCDLLCEQDNSLIVVHQNNKRQGAARNTGLDICTGEYVFFLDSDDWIESTTIGKLVDLIDKHKAQIAVCGCFSQDANGNIIKELISEKEIVILNQYQAFESYVFNTPYCNHSPCDKLYARSVFEKERFIENSYYEDLGSIYKFISHANRVVYTNEPLYCYCENLNSTMHKQFSPHEFDKVRLYHELSGYFLQKQRTNEYVSFIQEMDKQTMYCAIGYIYKAYNQNKASEYSESIYKTRLICKNIYSDLGIRLNFLKLLIRHDTLLFYKVWKAYLFLSGKKDM